MLGSTSSVTPTFLKVVLNSTLLPDEVASWIGISSPVMMRLTSLREIRMFGLDSTDASCAVSSHWNAMFIESFPAYGVKLPVAPEVVGLVLPGIWVWAPVL